MISKSCVLALILLAACDPQVDGDHRGDALATLSGTVKNRVNAPVSDAAVSVVWINSAGNPDLYGGESIEVRGAFPAQFELAIYTPPDPALLNDWRGVKVGVAFILANEPGLDWSGDEAEIGAKLLGGEVDHLLVYVPEDVPEGSDASYVLRSAPEAGFHIYGVHRLSEAEHSARQDCLIELGAQSSTKDEYEICGGELFDDFVPLDTDLETPLSIEILDDPSMIDFPNWT
jgi:hypothetical protein